MVSELIMHMRQQVRLIIVFILCSLLGTGSALLLIRDINMGSEGAHGPLMAKLERKEAKVRRKASMAMDWANIDENASLYKKDSVHTGAQSTAVIKMNEGATIELGENSLVVIDSVDQLTMNPVKGTFVVRTKDGDKKIDIDSAGKTRIQTLTLRPTAPAPYSVEFISANTESVEVKFAWEVKVPQAIKGTVLPKLEISSDKKFKNIVSSQDLQELNHGNAKATLPIGNYYWRITQEGTPLAENSVFRVSRNPILVPIEPNPGTKVSLFEQDPVTQFRWSLPSNPQALEDISRNDSKHFLEISDSENFQKVLRSQEINPESGISTVSGVPFGQLFWRIRSHYGKSAVESFVSKYSKFVVEKTKALVVTLGAPLNNSANEYAPQLRFNWSCDTAMNDQEFEILLKKKDGSALIAERVGANSYIWKQPTPGVYTWWVKVLWKGKALGESAPHSFSIFAGKPIQLVAPDKGAQEYYWDKPKATHFEWKSDELVEKQGAMYEVEFSKDPAFKSVEAKVPRLNKNEVSSADFKLENGEYFWRVHVVDSSGALIKESEVRQVGLGLHPRLKGPTRGLPNSGFTQNLLEEEKDLNLSWTEVKDAKSYEVVLVEVSARNPAGVNIPLAEQVRLEKLPGKTWFTVKADGIKSAIDYQKVLALPPAQYEWSVRAIDPLGRPGEWMVPQIIHLTAGKPLSAPDVLSPEVQ